MAYFPNGTSRGLFQQEQCSKCLHNDGCRVLLMHILHNGNQIGEDETSVRTKDMLELLIPTTDDGLFAGDCTMFYPTPNEATS